LVKEELGRVPCKDGHAWCRGTYRDQEHFDAWQTAFDNLWTAMEQMPDLPDTLRTPLSKVVEIRRDVPRTEDLQSTEWEEWFERDDAAAWQLFVALAKLDGRCKDCQRKAIAELGL
jgi:hypothetical protein